MDDHLQNVHTWSYEDKIRLVYICVIAGLVMARDEKKHIDHFYIKMVMDLDKVRSYPWGLKSFENLLTSIIKTRVALKKTLSYALDGFSYAFQIWVMEAIPDIGNLLGDKIKSDFTEGPRCSNWKGAAKVSYDDIILLESTFKPNDVVYPFISYKGNCDIIEALEFVFPGVNKDGEVDNVTDMIIAENDFGNRIWGSVEDEVVESDGEVAEDGNENVQENNVVEGQGEVPEDGKEVPRLSDEEKHVSGSKRRTKKQPDHGAETRKKKLLCQRAAATHGAFDEEMKSFIKGVFEASFSTFEKKIDTRLGKLETEVSLLKDSISTYGITRSTKRSTTSQPSNPAEQHSKSVVRKK